MNRVTIAELGTVKLTDNERRELTALHHSLIDRVNAAAEDIDAVRIIIEASANAVYDRDFIACLAANQTAMHVAQALRQCGQNTGAASVQGTANVVAQAALRMHTERQAAS